ncbi:hypothetical protein BC830DRAFT_1139668 [Chytriomyces sp. MP71]|nr:hypothetical protein BC830DRAFT_1139668 [Chytriomyces sp. MP71]
MSLNPCVAPLPALGTDASNPLPTFERRKPGRKPSSEPPSSKRAAQNRESQRSYQQRRQEYVKDLEARVKLCVENHSGFQAGTSSVSTSKVCAYNSCDHQEEINLLRQRVTELEAQVALFRMQSSLASPSINTPPLNDEQPGFSSGPFSLNGYALDPFDSMLIDSIMNPTYYQQFLPPNTNLTDILPPPPRSEPDIADQLNLLLTSLSSETGVRDHTVSGTPPPNIADTIATSSTATTPSEKSSSLVGTISATWDLAPLAALPQQQRPEIARQLLKGLDSLKGEKESQMVDQLVTLFQGVNLAFETGMLPPQLVAFANGDTEASPLTSFEFESNASSSTSGFASSSATFLKLLPTSVQFFRKMYRLHLQLLEACSEQDRDKVMTLMEFSRKHNPHLKKNFRLISKVAQSALSILD